MFWSDRQLQVSRVVAVRSGLSIVYAITRCRPICHTVNDYVVDVHNNIANTEEESEEFAKWYVKYFIWHEFKDHYIRGI